MKRQKQVNSEEILKMPRAEQLKFWKQKIAESIVEENGLQELLHSMIDIYQFDAFNRGKEAGKAEIAEMF